MQIWAYLADWEPLRREWERLGGEPNLGELIDEGADWIRNDSHTGRNDSYIMNAEVGEIFRAIKTQLPAATAESLGRFLTAFCPELSGDGYPLPRDVGTGGEVVYAALSPATTCAYLQLGEGLDLSAARSQVRVHLTGGGNRAVASAEEFAGIITMWLNVLREAREEGWGVLVLMG